MRAAERANGANVDSESKMLRSDSYRKNIDGTTLVSAVPANRLTQLTSETFYQGAKGDEISDYSFNYTTKLNTLGTAYDASVAKSTTFFFYDAGKEEDGTVRAAERANGANVDSESKMLRSDHPQEY